MEIAIYNDCRQIIENFIESEGSNFEYFRKQWLDLKFHHIYTAQTTTVELLQTTTTILQYARRVLCGEENWNIAAPNIRKQRIGGLYLIYVIYFKQPTENYVKVQISLKSFNIIKAFIDTLPTKPVYEEVRYIFWKLVQQNAFRYCALDFPIGLENLVNYDKIGISNSSIDKTTHSLRREFRDVQKIQNVAQSLAKLEMIYNNLKRKLNDAEGINQLSLPPSFVCKHINESLQPLQNDFNEEENERQSVNCKESVTDVGAQRRSLKKKAKATNNDESSIGAHQKNTNDIKGRVNIRQILADPLSEYLIDEIEANSDTTDNLKKSS